jgi:hypothetical protein
VDGKPHRRGLKSAGKEFSMKRNSKGAPAAVLALALVSWLAMTGCPADNPGGGETGGSTSGPVVVTSRDLSALVTAPKAWLQPDSTPIDATEYTGAIQWQTAAGGTAADTFADDTDYKAVVTLTAKNGYTFTGVAANSFTHTSAANVSNNVTNAENSGIVTILFHASAYQIGDTGPAGGWIFYANPDGFPYDELTWHYLEAAPADLVDQYEWGGTGYSCSTGTAIGTGASNTAELATHEHDMTEIDIDLSGLHLAARACADYSYGGYSDWFLPSNDELVQMYTNLQAQELGGFSNTYSWSSSEYSYENAWVQYFDLGYQFYNYKYCTYSVRPARAF